MKKHFSIIELLNKYIKLKSVESLLVNIFYFSIALLSLFIIIVFFEQFLYLNIESRLRIIIFLTSIIIVALVYIFTKYNYQIREKIESYKKDSIAKKIGEENPHLSDKLLNAYQLLDKSTEGEVQSQLKNKAIVEIEEQIQEVEFPNPKNIIYSKLFFVFVSLALIFIVFQSIESFNSASIRVLNPQKTYPIPMPFKIINQTEKKIIIEGDSLRISFSVAGEWIPDSLSFITKINNNISEIKVPVINNQYNYDMKNITDDFVYWAEYKSKRILNPWEKIISNANAVNIKKRPRINSINYTVYPPRYTELPPINYSSNNTDIPVLEGSTLQIEAKSNKIIREAWANINDEDIILSSNQNNIVGEIKILNDGWLKLMCIDNNDILNINPPANRINVISDKPPQIFVSSPDKEFKIEDDYVIQTDIQLVDDYGISDLYIEYKIIRPEYLTQDTTIYRHAINGIDTKLKAQEIIYNWDINNLYLSTDDQLKFYFLVSDNNSVTGPNISSAGPFIGLVPSLEDIFSDITSMEDNIIESTEEISLTVEEVQELVDELEKDLLKSDNVTWEQTKKINESSEKIEKIIEEMENIQETFDKIMEESENNDLFDKNLMDKFDEFQKLMDTILTEEMLEAMSKIKEMMSKMSTKQMLDSIQDLKQDMSLLEEQLDRFIELFERIRAEQIFDELIKQLEKLVESQIKISGELYSEDTNFDDLESNQNKQINGYDEFLEHISNNLNTISKFSKTSADLLSDLLGDDKSKETKESLLNTKDALSSEELEKAFKGSENDITNLSQVLAEIENIKNIFNEEGVDEMSLEFVTLIKNIEFISFDQERNINNLKKIKSYNPVIKDIAFNQNIIQNKIIKFIEQLLALSNKTFHLPPKINRSIGSAQLATQKSINYLEQKQIHSAKQENENALEAINETAHILLQSLKNMQSSMSASGMESYLEQLEQMAKNQEEINEGTGQCMNPGMGQGGMPGQLNMQQALMERLQSQQKALQQQLEGMLSDMPGEQGHGGLSKALEDMEEVIEDFKRKKIDRETIENQNKILSRMLDSQKSLKEKDYNEKRKSIAAEAIDYDGPILLPTDRGERQTMLTKLLQEALDEGYSTNYQVIIKEYFKNLEVSNE